MRAEPVGIAILAKSPVAGTVKTRLAMMLGVDGATALHERFVARTVEAAMEAATGPVTLWGSPDESHPYFHDLAQRFSLTLLRQPNGDLGERMHAAVAGGPTLVIGTDCPLMTATHLRDAAEVLRSGADAVVIPADDGGYVLIGLSRPVPELFTDMAWSTEGVMMETRQRLRRLGLSWREPTHLWDVDRPSDVRRMRREGLEHLLEGIDRKVPR
jgi:rSAM/selenodomain-associated transferase 1